MTTPLLAKHSATPDHPAPAETLEGHVTHVVRVAEVLAREQGPAFLQDLGLAPESYAQQLVAALSLAALLHDLGKANDHFQQLVRGETHLPQALRHEVVSLWLVVSEPAFEQWLFADQDPRIRWSVLRAVAGHHVRFNPEESLVPRSTGRSTVRWLGGHPDIASTLSSASRLLGLPQAPRLTNRNIDLRTKPRELYPLLLDGNAWWSRAEPADQRFAAAVAALLVGADVCGSALVRASREPATWAESALGRVCAGSDLIGAAERRLHGAAARPFQQQVANSPTRLTLVTAGCGTGKTVAAYLWAARHAAGRKLFFCYPTTGTASEGFADYAFPEFAGDAALVHSRARVDIERILDNGPDDEAARVLAFELYQGLALWDARVVVCTADTVLGLIQNNRAGLFASPAIGEGGFVFDEVHLYDDRMFGALLRFLSAWRGAPTLLMTATLPPSRRLALERLADELGERWTTVDGPSELETLPRYQISSAKHDSAIAEATRAAQDGARVLWVANTVERAVATGRQLESRGAVVEPYHSRYRYRDRLDRHRAVVDRFSQRSVEALPGQGAVAVTTQVCEVSLDISADLLVTELAPPASLIQRLGRLNRWATPDNQPPPRPAFIVTPPNTLPYADEALQQGREWLERVRGRPSSQQDLHAAFLSVAGDGQPLPAASSAWLDACWSIERRPLREAGPTFTVLRAEDQPTCADRRGHPYGPALIAASIPMLLTRDIAREAPSWPRFGMALVAPPGRIDYDVRWGARWRT